MGASRYMDRTYVVQFKKTPVFDMGLEIFQGEVARHKQVKDRLQRLLLERILNERNGEVIERDLVKSTLSMLVDLGVHTLDVYTQARHRLYSCTPINVNTNFREKLESESLELQL